jgi:hypothetical protein
MTATIKDLLNQQADVNRRIERAQRPQPSDPVPADKPKKKAPKKKPKSEES